MEYRESETPRGTRPGRLLLGVLAIGAGVLAIPVFFGAETVLAIALVLTAIVSGAAGLPLANKPPADPYARRLAAAGLVLGVIEAVLLALLAWAVSQIPPSAAP